jgi:predicted HTH domain antitoxin
MNGSQALTPTIQIPKEIVELINNIAKENCSNIVEVTQKLIVLGLRNYRIQHALDLYEKGQVSISGASEIAHIPIEEMLEHIIKNKILCQVSTEDLRQIHIAARALQVKYYQMLEYCKKFAEIGKE